MKKTTMLFIGFLFLVIQGQGQMPGVGVNTSQMFNNLSVSGDLSSGGGNVAIGRNFCSMGAPKGGMIVEGNVGIGTATPGPGLRLDVLGNANISGQFSAAGIMYPRTPGSLGMVLATDGIGTASWTYPLPKTYYNLVYPVSNGSTNIIGGSFGTLSLSYVPVSGSTLTLTTGTYVISAAAQILNDAASGTNVSLFDGTDYIGSATVLNTAYFGGWFGMTTVTITGSKTYTVAISTNTALATAYARNVSITAIKVQQ